MSIPANELRQYVIEPTLHELGEKSFSAVNVLLEIIQRATTSKAAQQTSGLGIYQMSPALHQCCWDQYLAFQPDLASLVRGLASQRRFLKEPDRELQTNLAYASALVWVYFKQQQTLWPSSDNQQATQALCSQYFRDNNQNCSHAA